MAGPDDPVSFNRRSADLIGREIKNMRGRGRGEQPLPRRRRATDGGGGGGGETIIIKIVSGDSITARSGTTRGSGSGTPMSNDLSTETGAPVAIYNLSLQAFEAPAAIDLYALAHKIDGDYYIASNEYKALTGFNPETDQSIGHDADLEPLWQDDINCATV